MLPNRYKLELTYDKLHNKNLLIRIPVFRQNLQLQFRRKAKQNQSKFLLIRCV